MKPPPLAGTGCRQPAGRQRTHGRCRRLEAFPLPLVKAASGHVKTHAAYRTPPAWFDSNEPAGISATAAAANRPCPPLPRAARPCPCACRCAACSRVPSRVRLKRKSTQQGAHSRKSSGSGGRAAEAGLGRPSSAPGCAAASSACRACHTVYDNDVHAQNGHVWVRQMLTHLQASWGQPQRSCRLPGQTSPATPCN